MFSMTKVEKDRYADGQSKVLQYFALRRIHNISKGAVLSTSLWTMIEFITQRDIHHHYCLVMGCEWSNENLGLLESTRKGNMICWQHQSRIQTLQNSTNTSKSFFRGPAQITKKYYCIHWNFGEHDISHLETMPRLRDNLDEEIWFHLLS